MKNRSVYILLTVILAAGTGCLSGCEKIVQSAVVEEKETETETGSGEALENSSVQNTEAMTVAEQVQAPDRYQVDEQTTVSIPVQSEDGSGIKGDASVEFSLKADAEIQVPQVIHICKKRAVPKKADKAEMEALLEKLSQGESNLEIAEENGSASADVTLDGIKYLCLYNTEDLEYISWFLNYAEMNGGNSAQSMDEAAAEIFAGAGAEKKSVTEEEALAFVKELGFQDFQLVSEYAEDIELEEGAVQKNRFQFERVVDGVPVSYVNEGLLPVYEEAGYWAEKDGTVHEPEDRTWEQEMLHTTYTAGILSNFIYSDGLEISDLSDEKLFLLPFEEIAQIFHDSLIPQIAAMKKEQRPTLIGLAEGLENQAWSQYPYADSRSIDITVTKVRLGYMRQRKDGSAEEGILTPVWDFYGTWTAEEPDGEGGYEEHTMDHEAVSLMTIDACTGSVIQRILGY